MSSIKLATRRARRRGIMFAVLAIAGLLIAGNQVSSARAAIVRRMRRKNARTVTCARPALANSARPPTT